MPGGKEAHLVAQANTFRRTALLLVLAGRVWNLAEAGSVALLAFCLGCLYGLRSCRATCCEA